MADDASGRLSAQAQIEQRISELETGPVNTTVQSSNFAARPGASYIVDAPSGGMTMTLPSPQSVTRGIQIGIITRNNNTVNIFPTTGTINNTSRLSISKRTFLQLVSDGMTGWFAEPPGTAYTVASPITLTGSVIGFDQTSALGNNARVAVAKNSGATVGTRRQLNLIEGSGITLTEADDGANERVNVTIAASGSGGLTQDQVLNLVAFRA